MGMFKLRWREKKREKLASNHRDYPSALHVPRRGCFSALLARIHAFASHFASANVHLHPIVALSRSAIETFLVLRKSLIGEMSGQETIVGETSFVLLS